MRSRSFGPNPVPTMIIGPVAPAVKRFCQTCLASADGLGVWAGLALPILLHGLLLACKRRSLEVLGDATLLHWLCAGSVCRWLARLRFPLDRWHEHACRQLLALAIRHGLHGTWFALFDGTDTKRGGLAKIQNTRRYGKKPKGKKGGRPSTQTHTFVLGLLLLPCGLRLPLPRKSWYTQAYARAQGLPYRRQVELVEELLRWLQPLLPAKTPLVVLVDSYLGAAGLLELCRQQGWTLITKLRTDRTFADTPRQRVVAYGQSLAAEKFRRCRLCRGREATAAYRRQPPRQARAHERRVYDYYSECRQVSRAGEVQVVYSWKTPAYTPQPNFQRRHFAALVTNNVHLTARQVIEYYELRWQIEVFFRELKGQLGLQDYQGTQFGSYERYVTLVLLGYLVLEYQRLRGLKGAVPGEGPRGGWPTARTSALLAQVRGEAVRADVRWVAQRLATRSGRRQLRKALQRAA
jgi:DDE family transposase